MNKALERYAEWLEDTIKEIAESQPNAIGVCAILPDRKVLTGYFDCGHQDKAVMGYHMTSDAIMDCVMASADRIVSAAAELEEEGEEDDD